MVEFIHDIRCLISIVFRIVLQFFVSGLSSHNIAKHSGQVWNLRSNEWLLRGQYALTFEDYLKLCFNIEDSGQILNV